MPPTYIKMHHGAVRYQRPIPTKLQRFYGGVRVVSEYLGRFVKGADDKTARACALNLALKHDEEFAEVERLAAAGALEGVQDVRKLPERIEGLTAFLTRPEMQVSYLLAPSTFSGLGREGATALRLALLTTRHEVTAELAAAKAVPLMAQAAPEFGWDTLY